MNRIVVKGLHAGPGCAAAVISLATHDYLTIIWHTNYMYSIPDPQSFKVVESCMNRYSSEETVYKVTKNILKNKKNNRNGIPKKQPNKVGTNDTTVP